VALADGDLVVPGIGGDDSHKTPERLGVYDLAPNVAFEVLRYRILPATRGRIQRLCVGRPKRPGMRFGVACLQELAECRALLVAPGAVAAFKRSRSGPSLLQVLDAGLQIANLMAMICLERLEARAELLDDF